MMKERSSTVTQSKWSVLHVKGRNNASYNTEKSAGMFGTLVVALLSSHTEGEVHASFGGQKNIWRLLPLLTLAIHTSHGRHIHPHQCTQVANPCRYSDVEHTVQPVSSRHRLVLTYSLIHVSTCAPQLASSLVDDQLKLKKLLAEWNYSYRNQIGCSQMLAYMLEHKYTDVNMRLAHLKGRDRSKANYLKAACEDQRLSFFLANLEHTKDGSCEEAYNPCDHYGGRQGNYWDNDEDSDEGCGDHHSLEEVLETSLNLRTLFRATGEQLATKISLKEHNIVQEDPFDRTPDDENYEGYTGNAGACATHYYRNSCIVIMPREHQSYFLLEPAQQGNADMEAWVGKAIEDVRQNPEDKRFRAELTRMCELILRASQIARDEDKRRPNSYSWDR